MSYDLYDVGSEVIARIYHVPPEGVKDRLLMLDPIDPRRAYKKMSDFLAIFNNGHKDV